ncbi:NAD(P)-binding protein [Rhizophagus irregularis]|uniref:NAD(P)-binding protein n=1 Tax=Rhizophagus irregularis TaxID=588596 RepID=A0A2N1N041_9GLOM|nr:NAD(P)-binding protein [Rhizophagus irregularis]
MTVKSNKGVILKAYPKGIPKLDENFELTHRTIDIECLNLKENEFVLRNLYLSIDPYVRVTLHDPALNFMKHGKMISTGQVISGLGVSEVVKTNNPNYKVGDLVYGPIGWEEYSHIKSDDASVFSFMFVNKELLKDTPLSYHASFLRFGGLTSYTSLIDIGKPKEGETIYVSTAAGLTGQLVGQIAKIKGLRVVGSTGSDEKVDFLLNELKFDAAFNYKKVDLDKALSEYCPNGIDIYYDNVGGKTLEVALEHCNRFARVVACGMISQYNIKTPEEGYGIKTLANIVVKSIVFQGFIALDYIGKDIEKEFEKDIIEWVKSGKIIYKETVIDGVENIAKAFVDMLNGKNIGKYVIKIADY